MSLLLDTHTLLWWTFQKEKLSRAGKTALNRAAREGRPIFISSISIWEIGIKIQKNKLNIGMSVDRFADILKSVKGVQILSVSTRVWLMNLQLDWDHRDPVDRTIVASALIKKVPLLTYDTNIRQSGVVEIIG
jgi:PIN domain nuclease of toxin-antitoxin system